MTELVRINSELTAEYRAVRLRALKDTPLAFGSTYEREVRLTEEEWQARAARLDGGRDVGYLARRDDGEFSGLALCLVDTGDGTVGDLISMWVAPEARKGGVGRMLIDAIAAWAAEHGVRTLRLMVTSVNDGAMEFYRRLGFERTGRTEPYPNDPAVVEYEMVRE